MLASFKRRVKLARRTSAPRERAAGERDYRRRLAPSARALSAEWSRPAAWVSKDHTKQRASRRAFLAIADVALESSA